MTQEQRLEYGRRIREVRHSMRLTLRELCIGMKMDSVKMSMLERGVIEQPKIEVIKGVILTVTCHRCEKDFEAHPIKIDGEPVIFPAYVCPICKEKDE